MLFLVTTIATLLANDGSASTATATAVRGCYARFLLPSELYNQNIPQEPGSIAESNPDLDVWAQKQLDEAYSKNTFEHLGVANLNLTRGEAYANLKKSLAHYFEILEKKENELYQALKREGKLEDTSDPRYIVLRNIDTQLRSTNYYKALLVPEKELGFNLSPYAKRIVEEIREFYEKNPDEILNREQREDTVYARFSFTRTYWSELATFMRVENGIHASTNVFLLRNSTTLPLRPEKELQGVNTEFDVIGMRTRKTRTDPHILIVGEVKFLSKRPLDLYFANGSSVVDTLVLKREKARLIFEMPIEYRIYSPTGFTPELREILTRKGFVLKP